MNSKTSFFNKTLFGADMKRYWWISAVYTLLLVVGCVMPLFNMLKYNSTYYGDTIGFYLWGSFAFFVSLVLSLGTGTLLFNFMHFNGSVSQMHSLPIKRNTVFSTKLISALALLLSPVIIVIIIIFAMSLSTHIDFEVGKWAYAILCYTLVVLSLTILVNMMSGTPIGGIVFTIGFIFLPLFVFGFIVEITQNEIHGFSQSGITNILNYFYIGSQGIVKKEFCFIYPLMSVLFLGLSYALYKKRKSESHGEVIAFKGLKPVFISVIAILASGIGYMYADGIFEIQNPLTIFPFGILGTLIAHMISKKAIDFKGGVKPVITYTALALVFVCIIKFDLTGYEKRIPKTENIKSASLEMWSPGLSNDALFTEISSLEALTSLHNHLTQNDYSRDGAFMKITYNLKNGKTLSREYYMNLHMCIDYLKPVFESREFLESKFKLLTPQKDQEAIYVEVFGNNGQYEIYYPTDENFDNLLNAIKQDLKIYPYENFVYKSNPTRIIVSWQYYSEDEKDIVYDEIEFNIYQDSINTNKILEEIGFYNAEKNE